MRPPQRRLLIQQHIHLDPNAIACMICRHSLQTGHNRGEAVGQVQYLAVDAVINRRASEAADILKRGVGPVVDDEEGQERGANRVKPPEVCLVADDGKEEGEGVEIDVGLAV